MSYTFTYTDTKYVLKLLGFSFGSFILLMILLVNITDIIGQYLGHGAFVLISVLTPLIIFLCFKKKIRRSGEAEISNGILHFNLDSKEQDIKIDDIENYKVEYNQGIVFKIKTRNGKKLKITANRNFCNPSALEALVEHFETIVVNAKSSHNAVSRIKSNYEKKGMFYFLLFVSLLFLGGIPFMLYLNGNIPGVVYIGLGIGIVAWADYFKTKGKFRKSNGHHLRS